MNILLVVICLQFAHSIYMDIQNRRERELLQLKLMSKDLTEYVNTVEEPLEEGKEPEEDPYLSVDEAGIEQIIRAKEK